MDTLAFGYILPTTGWIRDFNPLETCAARRTRKNTTTLKFFLNAVVFFLTPLLLPQQTFFLHFVLKNTVLFPQ